MDIGLIDDHNKLYDKPSCRAVTAHRRGSCFACLRGWHWTELHSAPVLDSLNSVKKKCSYY